MGLVRKMNTLKGIILLVVLIFACCENVSAAGMGAMEQTEDAAIYKEARRATFRKDWQKAASLFKKLKRDFPDSPYAVNSIYWAAHNIDKLSSDIKDLKQQIDLKEEALTLLDGLIRNYGTSTWASNARILRIKISKDMVIRGFNRYLANILQAVRLSEKMEDDVRMTALDSLYRIDKDKAFPVLKEFFTGEQNPRLWRKVLYWLQQRRSRESEKLLYSVYMETPDRELKKLLEPHIAASKPGDISAGEAAIPVRVFHKGSQVDDLSMPDFKLYENKQERKVEGFRIIKKRMKRQGNVPSRYFVLGFRITNYNKQVREGVDHLFKNILRKEDQLLVFINDKRLNFDNLNDLAAVQAEVNRVLRRESSLARGNMDKYLKEMERRLNPDKLALDWEMNSLAVVNLMKFLDVYRKAWQDYKAKYLLPDIDSYYRLAGHLEKIRKEKWVIHFYQVDMFPELAAIGVLKERAWEIVREISSYSGTRSYSRTLSRQLLDIDKLRNIADDFPVETISRLFYKADATFFTLFMHTTGAVLSKDFEYTRIASALEKSLRQVSLNTGGALIASNDLRAALDEIGEKESTSYMLNFTPGNMQKPGKIRVKASDNRYKVFYDENMRADYINDYLEEKEAKTPPVRVEDIVFKEKKLTVVISDFLLKSGPKGKTGRIDVQVRIKNKRDRVLFDQTRNITANRGTFRITLNFDWLQKGTYNIAVEVTDLFTGKTGTKTINREIR